MCTSLDNLKAKFLSKQLEGFITMTGIAGLKAIDVKEEDIWHTITAAVLANENLTDDHSYHEGNRVYAKHGDALLKSALANKIHKEKKRLTVKEITDLEQKYFTDDNLECIVKALELEDYLLVRPNQSVGTKTHATLFEAFFWFIHLYGKSKDELRWLEIVIKLTR